MKNTTKVKKIVQDLFPSADDIELIERGIERHRKCLGYYEVSYDRYPRGYKRSYFHVEVKCQHCGSKWETRFIYNPWYLFESGYPFDLFEKEFKEKFPQLDRIRELILPRSCNGWKNLDRSVTFDVK